MVYSISYGFSMCGTWFGGSENVCAKTVEAAIEKLRAKYPNKKLRMVVIRDERRNRLRIPNESEES